jgi:hypothetical protein
VRDYAVPKIKVVPQGLKAGLVFVCTARLKPSPFKTATLSAASEIVSLQNRQLGIAAPSLRLSAAATNSLRMTDR